MNEKTEWLITKLFIAYVLTTLIFPAAFFNKIFFICIFIIYMYIYPKIRPIINGPIIIASIFAYGFLLSQFTYSDQSLSRSFLMSVILLFLIYPIMSFKVDFDKVISVGGRALIIVDILFIMYGASKYAMTLPFGMNSLYNLIKDIIPSFFWKMIEKYGETAIGERGFFGNFNVMIHMGTVAFVYLPICLWYQKFLLEKKKSNLIWIFIGLFVIICSTSRALLLVTLGMMIFIRIRECKSVEMKTIFVLLGALLILIGTVYLIQKTAVFSSKELSNSIKIGHIASAIKSISPAQILFGKGLASYYYSTGVNAYLAHTEITLLDYFRYFGILLGSAIYFKLVFPLEFGKNIKTIKQNNVLTEMCILGGYLMISLTNPVLMNSMGTLVVLWYWSKVSLSVYN